MASKTDSNQLLLKLTTIDLVGGIFCNICNMTFRNKQEFDTHYTKHTGIKDIVYTCVVCRKESSGYPSFRGHCYTKHVIKNRFTCEECNKCFSKLQNLQEHFRLMHFFQCSTCKKNFSSKKELRMHEIVIHRENDEPICKICQEDIPTMDSCKQHIDLHLQYVYSCPICQEEIHDKDNSVEHLQKHFTNISSEEEIELDKEDVIEQLSAISCGFCSIICPNRVEFDAHFSCDHADEDIVYTCIVCGKQFDKYSLFRTHISNHYTDSRFECDGCPASFPRLAPLVAHVSRCASAGEGAGGERRRHKPYACFLCGHRYLTEHSLYKHVADAHNGFDFRCREPGCEQVFDKRRDLLLHSRQHNSKVQNWCRQCGQDFTSLASCEQHLQAHRRPRHACPVCGRHYAERVYLLKHIPQHFEAVIHVCKVCGRIYDAKRRLLEHFKTHSVHKAHSCTDCPKTFAKRSHLLQHMNTHSDEKPNSCTICEKSFSCSANLHKHLVRVHCVSSNKSVEKIRTGRDITKGENTQKDTEMKTCENNTAEVLKKPDWNTFFGEEMESDTIDQTLIENELQLFETQETANFKMGPNTMLESPPITSNATDPQTDSGVPLEYGPEIITPTLDDHMLPHIDPLLTIRHDQIPPDQYIVTNEANQTFYSMQEHDSHNHIFNGNQFTIENEKWEPPVITKVYPEYYSYEDTNRLSIMNTDIF